MPQPLLALPLCLLALTAPALAQTEAPSDMQRNAQQPTGPDAATNLPDATTPTAPPGIVTGAENIAFPAPEGFVTVALDALPPDALDGAPLRDASGEDVATVSGAERAAGKVVRVLADVGGFLGMGARTVAFAPDQVGAYRNDAGAVIVFVTLDKDRIAALPEHKAE